MLSAGLLYPLPPFNEVSRCLPHINIVRTRQPVGKQNRNGLPLVINCDEIGEEVTAGEVAGDWQDHKIGVVCKVFERSLFVSH